MPERLTTKEEWAAGRLVNQRQWDLLRYCRLHLFTEDLISQEEYDDLAIDHPVVRRLEDYDAARQRLEMQRDSAKATARELATALRKAVEPYCKSCRGKRTISVKHGMTFITDNANEHALAYHNEPCPECAFRDLLARLDVQALLPEGTLGK